LISNLFIGETKRKSFAEGPRVTVNWIVGKCFKLDFKVDIGLNSGVGTSRQICHSFNDSDGVGISTETRQVFYTSASIDKVKRRHWSLLPWLSCIFQEFNLERAISEISSIKPKQHTFIYTCPNTICSITSDTWKS